MNRLGVFALGAPYVALEILSTNRHAGLVFSGCFRRCTGVLIAVIVLKRRLRDGRASSVLPNRNRQRVGHDVLRQSRVLAAPPPRPSRFFGACASLGQENLMRSVPPPPQLIRFFLKRGVRSRRSTELSLRTTRAVPA